MKEDKSTQQKYAHTYLVRGSDIDVQYCLTPLALMGYLHDCAARECDDTEMAAFHLHRQGQSWIMSEMRVDLLASRLPRWRSEVRVLTWSQDISGIRFRREFEVWLQDELLAVASTFWSVIDEQTRRPLPAEHLPLHRFRYLSERVFPDLPRMPRLPALAQPLHQARFQVRMPDVDFNMHLNSLRYVQEALLAQPQPEGLRLGGLHIKYQQECYLHEHVLVGVAPEAEGHYLHQLWRQGSSPDEQPQELARMRSWWVS